MSDHTSPQDRVDPPFAADERTMLEAWLEFHRATLLRKCEGLTDDQLRTAAAPPSNLTLMGLARHMQEVERNWFRQFLGGEAVPNAYTTAESPDADLQNVDQYDGTTVLGRLRAEIEACRQTAARYRSLEHTTAWQDHHLSLRWIYVHMIEEYARHNGHADLLREAVDGATGV